MATINDIKTANDVNIRQKTLPRSITKTNDADMRDVIANEILQRGCLRVGTTGALAGVNRDNTATVLVRGIGFFESYQTNDPANNITTFASASVGWLWKAILIGDIKEEFELTGVDEDDEFVLNNGFYLKEVWWKSDDDQSVAKIGTTDGGNEIMFSDPDNPFPQNKWRLIRTDVIADGTDVTLFFRGFSGNVSVKIVKSII